MTLQRIQKKLILLRYPRSKLWMKSIEKNPHSSTSENMDGLFGENFSRNVNRWIREDDPHPNINFVSHSMRMCEALGLPQRNDLFHDTVRSTEFGKILGLSRSSCKYLVDSSYAESNNLFDSIIYDKRQVEGFIDEITGLYKLYLFIPDMEKGAILALSVRYYLPLDSDLRKNKGYRVRCKAVINAVEEHESGVDQIIEYDGYLSYETHSISFSLESRPFRGERRKIFLSFSNKIIADECGNYYYGGYTKSRPLTGTSNNFGPASLIKIHGNTMSIRTSTNLLDVEDDYNKESSFSSILGESADRTLVNRFLRRHGWVTGSTAG